MVLISQFSAFDVAVLSLKSCPMSTVCKFLVLSCTGVVCAFGDCAVVSIDDLSF